LLLFAVVAGIVAQLVGMRAVEPRGAAERPRSPSGAESAAASAAGWPNLFGPTHDSRSPEVIRSDWPSEGLPEAWRVPVGTGYSSPIVVADRVVLLHRVADEEVVSCLDASSGDNVWERRYPTTFVCGSHYTHGPYSTPASNGERVVTLGAQGQLHCLDLAGGGVLWERDTSGEFRVAKDIFGVGHSPVIWKDRVILNVGGTDAASGVVAFELSTGHIAWRAAGEGPGYATPLPATIHGRERLFVLTKAGLVMLDPADGRVIWEAPYTTSIPDAYAAVTPVVWEDLVYVSLFGRGSMCLRVRPDDTHETVWDDRRRLTSQYNPVLCADGCLYGIHVTDKSFRCLDLQSGEVLWRWKSPLARSTHLIAGGQILLFGEFGELGLIDLDARQAVERAMTTTSVFDGERCFSAPALANGFLYLRNEKELVCLDLRP
jgi:outer membrane protein assembly factor BamB